MGMFDEVYCEANLPSGHPDGEREFQTKSLFSCLDSFTITKEGRLILHGCRYEPSGETGDGLPMFTRVPTEDVDMDFHGDIRLISTVEGRCIEYAARFTHGNLEWIRPWSELPELHQSLLTG
jgi:hypothetical protein